MTSLENPTAPEGRRARKRRETRARIAEAAQTLFIQKGFQAVTVDEIAEAADVSARSFFDYFPTKEDVVWSWQDEFRPTLVEAVAARPLHEPLPAVAEQAMLAALAVAAKPRAMALDRMVRSTPVLHARNQAKYASLEEMLFEELRKRTSTPAEALEARLLAMVAIGVMRVGTDAWYKGERSTSKASGSAFSRQAFGSAWESVGRLFRQESA